MAIRSLSVWLFGMALVVGGTRFGRPSRTGSVSLWIGLFVLAGQFCTMLGAMAMGVVAVKWVVPESSPILLRILSVCGLLAGGWLNSIATQAGQNLGYRMIGVAPKPIRWYRGYKPKKVRNRHR